MKTWKRAFAFAAAIAAGAAVPTWGGLQYIDETGAPATVQSYTAVEESDYIWSTGWYAVTNNVTVETRADGHAVVECPLDADESLRSASFFLPSISLCPPKMTIDSLSSHIIVVKPISSSSTSSSTCRPASRPFRRSSSSVRSLRRFSPTTSPPPPSSSSDGGRRALV